MITGLRRAAALLGVLVASATAQAQPTISNLYPDGTYLLQGTNKFSFDVTAPAGVTNVSVSLAGTTLDGATVLTSFATGAGLTVNGSTYSCPLRTNVFYTTSIIAKDGNGAQTTKSLSFDTISPSYTWEAEDYDYGGGHYIDNPQFLGYWGLGGLNGTDFSCNQPVYAPHSYRVGSTNYAVEVCGDKKRLAYANTNEYSTSFQSSGNWLNYTRKYPAGTWYIWVRVAGNGNGNSPGIELYQGNFATDLGHVNCPGTGGWQVYGWQRLLDTSGNPVQWTTDGNPQILTVYELGGNFNLNFYMLTPAIAAPLSDAQVESAYPNGAYQNQATNTLSFHVVSRQGVNPSTLVAQLTATNLIGTGSTSLRTVANGGLTVSGTATDLIVTTPLASNTVYSAAIAFTDAFGTSGGTNLSFDTITPAYTWEAEDYNYGGGLYIDILQTNGYATLTSVVGTDCLYGGPSQYASWPYRPETFDATGTNVNPAQGASRDVPRLAYLDGTYVNYSLNFNAAGNWAKYTRHYPVGAWNIYMRCSGNPGGSDSAELLVGGAKLGQFNIPNTGSWDKYTWVPLVDTVGNIITWNSAGSETTFTFSEVRGTFNPDYFMLMPDAAPLPAPIIGSVYPSGTYQLQATNKLSFTVYSPQGVDATNVVVQLTKTNLWGQGTVATLTSSSGLTITGPSTNLLVMAALESNCLYTASIRATSKGQVQSTSSVTFDTIAPAYSWEAVDYDYSGGQYFDNPQTNAYAGFGGTVGTDSFYPDPSEFANWPYRPENLDGVNGDLAQEPCGDLTRLPFMGTGFVNYSLSFSKSGNWANYTRPYPGGNWNIYGRCAGNPGGSNVVTFYQGGTNGTLLGYMSIPNTGGWQNYTWVPLRDASGNPVIWTAGSNAKTLTMLEAADNFNLNYYMLLTNTYVPRPTLTMSHGNNAVSIWWAPTGGTLWSSSALGANANWQAVGTANPAVIPTTNSARFFRVSIP